MNIPALSRPAKEAIKTALAVIICYAIGMGMGWDKPFWAAFTVITVNLLSSGVSLQRGILRSSGTFVGCLAALALIGMFPQDRFLHLAAGSVFVGFCTYMLTGKNEPYFWFICAMTFLIIMPVTSPFESSAFFHTAMTRALETAMGAVVYTLVAVFLWPQSSKGMLDDTSRKLWAVQAGLFRAYRRLMAGEEMVEDTETRRLQQAQLSRLFSTLLEAAEGDTYEVWEVRDRWRQFRDQSTELMLALERWRVSFSAIRELQLGKLMPNLETALNELDARFDDIGRMLEGEAPDRAPQIVSLSVDEDELDRLTNFQRAAIEVTNGHLESIDRLSRALHDCVRVIRGHGLQAAAPSYAPSSKIRFAIDRDRLRAAFDVVVTLWIGFVLWVYFNPPGSSAFPMMAAIFALIIAMVPQAGTLLLFLSWGGGAAFAGVLNVVVMTQLSGFAELSIMIFLAFFAMYYVLRELRQTVARMFCMASFLILIGIENEQSYNFAGMLISAAWLMLTLAVAVAVTYLPPSPRPEKVFLRLQGRFFRRADYAFSRLAPDSDCRRGTLDNWKRTLFNDNLIELTEKLAAMGRRIDSRTVPGQTPEQIQQLVASLKHIAFRLMDLVDACERPQARDLVQDLIEDLASWHSQIAEHFRLRADEPGIALQPRAEFEARLAARLTRMEGYIDETRRRADKEQFSEQDYANFYRLLGSYRGLVEAVIVYARLADRFDWKRWQEARF